MFKVLFQMYVDVVFVSSCLYSAVSLTLVREQPFKIIIYYYMLSHMCTAHSFSFSCVWWTCWFVFTCMLHGEFHVL